MLIFKLKTQESPIFFLLAVKKSHLRARVRGMTSTVLLH